MGCCASSSSPVFEKAFLVHMPESWSTADDSAKISYCFYLINSTRAVTEHYRSVIESHGGHHGAKMAELRLKAFPTGLLLHITRDKTTGGSSHQTDFIEITRSSQDILDIVTFTGEERFQERYEETVEGAKKSAIVQAPSQWRASVSPDGNCSLTMTSWMPKPKSSCVACLLGCMTCYIVGACEEVFTISEKETGIIAAPVEIAGKKAPPVPDTDALIMEAIAPKA